MTYNTEVLKSSSEKDFIVILRPAIRISDWTLSSGTVYYNDFSVSDEFIEYVVKVKWNGVELDSVISTPNSGEFFWDYSNKKLYINNGSTPIGKYVTVFFEVYFGTKTINTYRSPLDNTTDIVYFAPRILSAEIPQINNEDILLFGSYSGSISLINSDSAFYVYEDVSFRRKEIEIYHIVNGVNNIKLVYKGFTESLIKNDKTISFNYFQIDFIFNRNISSYPRATFDSSKGFVSVDEYPGLDTRYDGHAIRVIYGVVDDIFPINIDYNAVIATNVNRDWIVRNMASDSLINTQNVANSPSSTTTRVYLPNNHGYFVDESVIVNISSVDKYCSITAIGLNYIDVTPALSGAPGVGDFVTRGSIGYVKIKDQNGSIYNLLYGRDFTIVTYNGVSGDLDALGIQLTDNFEANHPTLGTFNPESHKIFIRVYGHQGDVSLRDTDYKVITKTNHILNHILETYVELDASTVNFSDIASLDLASLGFSIPQDLSSSTDTYRDVLKNIMVSSLSQIYFDEDFKLNLRVLGPLEAATYSVSDTDLLTFEIQYSGDDIYNLIRVLYTFKEAPDGSDRSSHRWVTSRDDTANYLHEENNEKSIYTYLLKQSEAQVIADRYAIIFGDWLRTYSFSTKTQLINTLIGDVIQINRSRNDGHNFSKKILRSKNIRVTSIKKSINQIDFSGDPQIAIENGDW